MKRNFETDLYQRLFGEISKIKIIDSHEHLMRDSELPQGDDIHVGRFFSHYAMADMISAGMPVSDLKRATDDPAFTPKDRWALLAPWYKKTYNTNYCEALRIAIRDLYDVEDFSQDQVDKLTNNMRKKLKPGINRKVFDMLNIDYAMNHPLGPKQVYNPDFEFDCFICDMTDELTFLNFKAISEETGMDILCLDDYLKIIDFYFDRDAECASAYKTGQAYERILYWEDVPRHEVEGTFNRLLAFNDRPDDREIKKLQDFLMHYICRKCGEYNLPMKFHTGMHDGNGNLLSNSRALLLSNLFMKYPKTKFDIFHISYPYEGELTVIAKNFPNVTVDFCWMWLINPAAGRRALSEMLDAVPVSKIYGLGCDEILIEGAYGHGVIALREITRVLCEKVEEGKFSEDYALEVAKMILRDNAIENFNLTKKRKAFKKRLKQDGLIK